MAFYTSIKRISTRCISPYQIRINRVIFGIFHFKCNFFLSRHRCFLHQMCTFKYSIYLSIERILDCECIRSLILLSNLAYVRKKALLHCTQQQSPCFPCISQLLYRLPLREHEKQTTFGSKGVLLGQQQSCSSIQWKNKWRGILEREDKCSCHQKVFLKSQKTLVKCHWNCFLEQQVN